MAGCKKRCGDTEHNFIKIAEEKRHRMTDAWDFYNYKVYILCCSKCGETRIIEGGAE